MEEFEQYHDTRIWGKAENIATFSGNTLLRFELEDEVSGMQAIKHINVPLTHAT